MGETQHMGGGEQMNAAAAKLFGARLRHSGVMCPDSLIILYGCFIGLYTKSTPNLADNLARTSGSLVASSGGITVSPSWFFRTDLSAPFGRPVVEDRLRSVRDDVKEEWYGKRYHDICDYEIDEGPSSGKKTWTRRKATSHNSEDETWYMSSHSTLPKAERLGGPL